MPLFEFTCSRCGERFEDLVLSEKDVPVCPACGATSVNRELSVFATSTGSKSPCEMGSCNLPGGPASCPGCSCPFGS